MILYLLILPLLARDIMLPVFWAPERNRYFGSLTATWIIISSLLREKAEEDVKNISFLLREKVEEVVKNKKIKNVNIKSKNT